MAEIKPEVLKTLRLNTALQGINQGTSRTHGFNVDFKEFNENFVGRFVVRHPSQMDRLQIGVLKSQLLGGVVPLDNMTDNIAHIISTLDTVIVEKPEWFSPFDPDVDYEILEAVYTEYLTWINTFRDRAKRAIVKTDSGDNTGEV